MKIRIHSILLLLILILPVTGTYILFKHRQYQVKSQIKQKIKEGVSEDDLFLLKIPLSLEQNSNSVFKRINSKEFKYYGEMYDVVRQVTLGNTTYYWCIWDKEETALFAKLDELFAKAWGNDPVKESNSERLISFYKGLFTPPLLKINFNYKVNIFKEIDNYIVNFFPNVFIQVLTPPPKFDE